MGEEEAGGLELLCGRGGLAVGVGVGEGLGAPGVLTVALHRLLVLHLLTHHAAQTLVLQLQLPGGSKASWEVIRGGGLG